MGKFICVHGHFYQPPRENPWLGAVEKQDSAAPFHDWNERITAECYAPNTAARILDGENRIIALSNNYTKISFNFGPTLLSWMETAQPDVYAAVVAADAQSRGNFGGHGSAMAQAYNHMIMPLANEQDRATQAAWGVADFLHRFKRHPEGMWLPETAVNLASLEALAGQGIRFTVLAPHQARRSRRFGSRQWTDASGGKIDTTRVYQVRLPSGRTMALFFYNGPLARAVAFEGLLRDGMQFARRLAESEDRRHHHPQLLHIATDGETYGHHHQFGDMALAVALRAWGEISDTQLTNYAQFLDQNSPSSEVEIVEDSSWSCAHGIERWRSACGCNSGGHGDWKQEWRRPLRDALDWLRDTLATSFESETTPLFHHGWAARNEYIEVVLDRTAEEKFLRSQAREPLDEGQKKRALAMMEAQHQAMLMYTSCGWFFDEISGIETVQVLEYAARAMQLGEEAYGLKLEELFLKRLEAAPSNLSEFGNGRGVYEKLVVPARTRKLEPEKEAIELGRALDVAAEAADGALFDQFGKERERLLAKGQGIPPRLQAAAEYTLRRRLYAALSQQNVDAAAVASLTKQAEPWGVKLDLPALSRAAARGLERTVSTKKLDVWAALQQAVLGIIQRPDLWRVQNLAHRLREEEYPKLSEAEARVFARLGEELGVRVPERAESKRAASISRAQESDAAN